MYFIKITFPLGWLLFLGVYKSQRQKLFFYIKWEKAYNRANNIYDG